MFEDVRSAAYWRTSEETRTLIRQLKRVTRRKLPLNRKEAQQRTMETRKSYNSAVRGQSIGLYVSIISTPKLSHFCRLHTLGK